METRKSIYPIIEKALASVDRPLSAPELMDIPEVRQAALERYGADVQLAINKLSDALGFMWRRESINRYPAALDGLKARYAYGPKTAVEAPEPISPPINLAKKPVFTITEAADSVTFDFEYFTLLVKKR
jgi:hypothetical protein